MDQQSYSASGLSSSHDMTIDQLPSLFLQNQQSPDNIALYNPSFQHLQGNESQLSQSSEAINIAYNNEEADQKPDLSKISKGTCYNYTLTVF